MGVAARGDSGPTEGTARGDSRPTGSGEKEFADFHETGEAEAESERGEYLPSRRKVIERFWKSLGFHATQQFELIIDFLKQRECHHA